MEGGINFGALVRKITLYQCIILYPDWEVKPRPLQAVFQRCVLLEELSFIRDPCCEDGLSDRNNDMWWMRMGEPGNNPFWILPKIVFPALQARSLKTPLRKLELAKIDVDNLDNSSFDQDVTTMYAAFHNLILASPRLTSLALPIYRAPTKALPSLPLLEELYLDFHGQAPRPSSRAIWMWDLPRLRSLTVSTTELPTIALEPLGRSLTYLHLSSSAPCTGVGFAQLARLCPLLEHLVFYPQAPTAEGICVLFDPTEPLLKLRHLDVWIRDVADTQTWTPSAATSLLELLRPWVAPALESARGLLAVTPLPRDLPTICHPAMLAHAAGAGAGGTRFACVRDVWMVQTTWCVQPLGDWWLDEGMWLGPDPDPDAVSEGDLSNRGEESESVGWTSDSESDDDWQRPASRRIHRRI